MESGTQELHPAIRKDADVEYMSIEWTMKSLSHCVWATCLDIERRQSARVSGLDVVQFVKRGSQTCSGA